MANNVYNLKLRTGNAVYRGRSGSFTWSSLPEAGHHKKGAVLPRGSQRVAEMTEVMWCIDIGAPSKNQ